MARAKFGFHDREGNVIALGAEYAARIFEDAMGCLDPHGNTGICNAFSTVTARRAFAAPEAPIAELDDDSYSYLEGFEPFQWLAPQGNEYEGGAYWFRNYRHFENGRAVLKSPAKRKAQYEHRLTALAFMAAICRAGDAE